jgi:hypothetical protein
MTSDLVSRVYRPDPAKCCEACAFGRGNHAPWCPEGRVQAMKADGRRDPLCRACLFGGENHAEWCNAPQSES